MLSTIIIVVLLLNIMIVKDKEDKKITELK